MPGLRRAAPSRLVLDLTQQLAEDYDSIPLPTVAAVVKAAVATTTGPDGTWDGKPEGLAAFIEVIEHVARDDLDAMTQDAKPSRGARAPQGAARSGRRRGAASPG